MIVDIVFGFLGAGKTTFITRALQDWGRNEKIVVLVNEFGEVGIDGDLLAAQGGNIVEMPSGCICCTLQADFKTQLLEITRNIQPRRVIVEPTGVATVTQVRSILEAQLFEDTIREINDILIVDAVGFMRLYKSNRHFVESQVENAKIAILNKCDKVDKKKAMVTRSAISAINPEITVLMTEFGAVDWADYRLALSAAPRSRTEMIRGQDHQITILDGETSFQHAPHFNEEENALGYESCGLVFENTSFDPQSLERFFLHLNEPDAPLGEIVRAKGIFQIADKGVLMELSSGDFSSQPVGTVRQSKVSIIGKRLKRKQIGVALEHCRVDRS